MNDSFAAWIESFARTQARGRATTNVPPWQIQANGVVWYGATVSQDGAVILR